MKKLILALAIMFCTVGAFADGKPKLCEEHGEMPNCTGMIRWALHSVEKSIEYGWFKNWGDNEDVSYHYRGGRGRMLSMYKKTCDSRYKYAKLGFEDGVKIGFGGIIEPDDCHIDRYAVYLDACHEQYGLSYGKCAYVWDEPLSQLQF